MHDVCSSFAPDDVLHSISVYAFELLGWESHCNEIRFDVCACKRIATSFDRETRFYNVHVRSRSKPSALKRRFRRDTSRLIFAMSTPRALAGKCGGANFTASRKYLTVWGLTSLPYKVSTKSTPAPKIYARTSIASEGNGLFRLLNVSDTYAGSTWTGYFYHRPGTLHAI